MFKSLSSSPSATSQPIPIPNQTKMKNIEYKENDIISHDNVNNNHKIYILSGSPLDGPNSPKGIPMNWKATP